MRRRDEEGVALLTMLLLVAVMSVLAVSVLEDIRFAVRRATNAQAVGQAQWYGLGAEALARRQLVRLAAGAERTPMGWNGQWRAFPIDGGAIRMRLDDGGNCFNLNSVVEGVPEYWLRRETGLRQYRTLLRSLGFSAAEVGSLSEALADWIDTDSGRSTLGAEDEAYLSRQSPYRTSGALLSEVSELRAVRGYGPGVYQRIRPFVCALPGAELSPLNVNTLTPEQGVLITMITDGVIFPERARRLIETRPAGGWPSTEAFWGQGGIADGVPAGAALAQAGVRTRYFALTAEVSWDGGEALMTALLDQSGSGPAVVTSRRWTIDE